MNRAILNLEAVIFSQGLTRDGENAYTVQLLMNHHPIASWAVGLKDGYLMSQDRGKLESFVSSKFFGFFHG